MVFYIITRSYFANVSYNLVCDWFANASRNILYYFLNNSTSCVYKDFVFVGYNLQNVQYMNLEYW